MSKDLFKENCSMLTNYITDESLKSSITTNNYLTYWETCFRQDFLETKLLPIESIAASILDDLLSKTLLALELNVRTNLHVHNESIEFSEKYLEYYGSCYEISDLLEDDLNNNLVENKNTHTTLYEGLINFLKSYDAKRDTLYLWSDGLFKYMTNNPIQFLSHGVNLASVFIAVIKKSHSQKEFEKIVYSKDSLKEYMEVFLPYAESIVSLFNEYSINVFSINEKHSYKDPIRLTELNPRLEKELPF